jgi:hypothetical protein
MSSLNAAIDDLCSNFNNMETSLDGQFTEGNQQATLPPTMTAPNTFSNTMTAPPMPFSSQGDGQSQGAHYSTSGLGGFRDRRPLDNASDPLDEDDIGLGLNTKEAKVLDMMVGHLKALQTAVSVPVFEVVTRFDGDPTKFKQYVRDIECYAQMAGLADKDIPRIVNITCSGAVKDFVKRYIDEVKENRGVPTWAELKDSLQKRFAETTDQQQALAMLRQLKQEPNEPVQIYSERLQRIAEDAFPRNLYSQETEAFVQKQLVDIFTDGLYFDYLRMKMLRENPPTFEAAVECAMKEQKLRQRFNLRADTRDKHVTNNAYWPQTTSVNYPPVPTWPSWSHAMTMEARPMVSPMTDTRGIEPMEIDHLRNQRCFKCEGKGHRAKHCPTGVRTNTKGTPRQVYLVSDQTDDDDTPDNKHTRTNDQKGLKSAKILSQAGVKSQGQTRNRDQGRPRQQNTIPQDIPDWIRGAECFWCHMIGHLKRNCPQRVVPDRNRPPMHYHGHQGGLPYNGQQGGPQYNGQQGGPQFRGRQGN